MATVIFSALMLIVAADGRATELLPASPRLEALIKHLVTTSVPLTVEEKEGWGDQVRIFDGWKVRGKGIKIRLEERKKAVNHGLWRHYRLNVVDPIKDIQVNIPDLRYVSGEGIHFQINISAHLHGYADFKQYSNGVKLFSAATEAEFDVKTELTGLIQLSIGADTWSPELLISPQVKSVRLSIPNIDVRRIGDIRGQWARETGDAFRKMVERHVRSEETDVAIKINHHLRKQWDDGTLKVSLTSVLAN